MDDASVFDWFRRCILIATPVAVGIFWFTRPEPQDAPPNSVVFGCYAANNAPPIRLDDTGMHIRQDGIGTIGYHLEARKTGIALAAERPIHAQLDGNFYRFSIAKRGTGMFLPFFRDGGDARYGVFDGNNLHSFEFITDESNYLLYRETDSGICQVSTDG
jgi:hypothetical protein